MYIILSLPFCFFSAIYHTFETKTLYKETNHSFLQIPMAEIVVSAVITVLCEKLISGDLMKLARTEGIDSQLHKLEKTLPLIKAVLADANQKHITERAVQLWLNDLQDLAYDIDDIVDDLATEALRRSLNQEALAIIPNCCTTFTPGNIMYGRKMRSELDEITAKLHDLVDRKDDLGLNVSVERSNITERRLEQTSLVDESKIMGREGDKEALLKKLLGNEESDENVSIVSIVGMGGIGKTTLAKVLYNEEKVKDHFELRAWVCASEELDVFNISKAIFEAVGGDAKRLSNLDLLHVALKEKLLKKRFLLVLDDVWNEDHNKWELLQSPLLVGAPGSRVLVTTRSTKVASVMDSEEAFDLEVLSNEDALSLFAKHALGEKNFHKHPTLKLLGEGIVKKCGRLPLALKTLGRVLKGNRNADEWEKLLNTEIWNINDGSEILPALRLSYYHLPSHLKLLFAYCSLFPKDYEFQKNDLILLWMAEGFLSQSDDNKSMESLGSQYFEELKLRSFFQQSTHDQLGYTMHDLVNDLATSVAGELFYRSDGMNISKRNENFEKFRYFSLVAPKWKSYIKLKELQRAKRLRTFLPSSSSQIDSVVVKSLHELQFLRVLRLSGPGITQVPQSIGSLKHLRYLNFSFTDIRCLPEQVSDLYNLQSLLVRGCRELSDLPKSFAKLINLRHLDIDDTPNLNKMPLGIGGLTNLQTLSKVIIEEANGFKITDLKGLSDLQGELSIIGLDKLIDPIQAKDANLDQKKGLEVLEMRWSNVFDDSRNEMIEYEVLKELRPHLKLKVLKISNNKGTQFPSWVGDPSFDQLTELMLRGCKSTHLPTLGNLRSLKKLVISSCHLITSLAFSIVQEHPSSLSKKIVSDSDCDNIPPKPIQANDFRFLPMPRLISLQISYCKNLKSFPFQSLTSLEKLLILECPSMEYSFPCGMWPPNLRSLTIGGLNKPMSEWGPQNFPTSLVELHLYGKNSGVTSFAVAADTTTPSSSSSFLLPPSLVSLRLDYFMDVESFSEVLRHLPCLNKLDIHSCPKIRDLKTTSGRSKLMISMSHW
ncbi:unnamed protein product [Lactuca virosa]|uniref:Disease resistance RPP13-like protein 1 n=1 Tax=Lactuca virosa TaxID=75947 RepID=A0AAU9NSD1_9ASTR|nr:unnamed protein product [Lactuca virosa]